MVEEENDNLYDDDASKCKHDGRPIMRKHLKGVSKFIINHSQFTVQII